MKLYFAYGSNLNMKKMKKRCPDSKIVGKGILMNSKLTFRGKYNGVANVERSSKDIVYGALYEISKKDEKELDYYEGYPNLYIKKRVYILTKEKVFIEAFAYIMIANYELEIPTRPYYLEILQGYRDWDIESKFLNNAVTNTYKKIKGSEIKNA